MIPRNTPQTIQDCPILQWASGHTQARMAGQGRFLPFVGFHVEREKDAALDALLAAAGTPKLDIRHPRPGGSEIKPHWSFGESIRIYPITAGPPATTISGCLRLADATAAAGLGLAWPNGEKSRLAVRGLILIESTPVLLQLSVRSTMTDALLSALCDHYRVCAAADSLIKRDAHPDPVAFHELALPLTAGAETTAGRGADTAQITPFVSDHPVGTQDVASLTRTYVTSCWRRSAIHEAATQAWPGIVVWAAGYRSGEANGDSHLDASQEAPPQRPRSQIAPQGVVRPGAFEEADPPL